MAVAIVLCGRMGKEEERERGRMKGIGKGGERKRREDVTKGVGERTV